MMFKVKKLWFSDDRMFIETNKNKTMSLSVRRFPRLLHATDKQRQAWVQYFDALRWDEIDEDIHLKSFQISDDDASVIRWT
jgi:hypothetical protein